jgi:hypothetical protein
MAYIQSKPVHDSEAQRTKDFQAANAKSASAGSSHRPNEAPSHGFEIMGFPWQFAAVVGIIVGSVLVIVLKAIW